MRRRLLYWLAGFLPIRHIRIEGRPYLERYRVGRVFGLTFYLHRFVSGDAERYVHDHPWRLSLAFVLVGRYVEERLRYLTIEGGWHSEQRTVRWLNVLTWRSFHRITAPQPETWTLFIHARYAKSWGFLAPRLEREGGGATYQQPYEVKQFKNWHERARRGRDCAERVPLGGGA